MNGQMVARSWATLVGILVSLGMPQLLAAGEFRVVFANVKVDIPGSPSFHFFAEATARYEGNPSGDPVGRFMRTFPWQTQGELCGVTDECGGEGWGYPPPFFNSVDYDCDTEHTPGCPGHMWVPRMGCNESPQRYFKTKGEVLKGGNMALESSRWSLPQPVPRVLNCGPFDPPCLDAFEETTTYVLERGAGLATAREQLRFPLERHEERPESSVYIEEWAIRGRCHARVRP